MWVCKYVHLYTVNVALHLLPQRFTSANTEFKYTNSQTIMNLMLWAKHNKYNEDDNVYANATHIHTHTSANKNTYEHSYIEYNVLTKTSLNLLTYIPMYVCMYYMCIYKESYAIYTHRNRNIYICLYACLHTYIHKYMNLFMYACMYLWM